MSEMTEFYWESLRYRFDDVEDNISDALWSPYEWIIDNVAVVKRLHQEIWVMIG